MKASGATRLAGAIAVCAIAAIPATVAAQAVLDRIVAIVENEAITERELRQNITRTMRMLTQQKREIPNERTLAGQVLQQMIVRQLQLQEAKNRNIIIDEITLDRAIESMAKRKNLSLDDFERSFKNSDEDYQDFRRNVRDQLAIQQLLQREVIDQIQVSEPEIEDQLAASGGGRAAVQHHFAQLRIAPDSPGASATAKQRLLQIRKQLRGKSFSSFGELRKQFSQLWKAASAKDGVTGLTYRIKDLKWRYLEELPKPVSRRIDALRNNHVSPIISGKNSLHLFYRLASRGDGRVMMQRQYRVRHIMIPTSLVDDDERIRRRLIVIKRKLKNGADFTKLACAYSQDPLSSTRGGDLGWSNLQGFVPEFAAAARQSHATNTIVGPFKTAYGWHLLETTDSKEQNVADDTLRQQAITKVRQGKSEESIKLWLLGLRERSRIEVRI